MCFAKPLVESSILETLPRTLSLVLNVTLSDGFGDVRARAADVREQPRGA